MQTILTRAEYDAETRRLLEAVGADVDHAMRGQYPKSAIESLRELWFRGVAIPNLPADRSYTAAELDAIALAADLAGGIWMTQEAQTARNHGRTLAEYRKALADPDSPENRLDCRE